MPRTLEPLPLRTRAELYNQLAAMETAGLPPDKAFGLLRVDRTAQPRVEMARKLLARGLDPAQAGEKSRLFSKLEVALVGATLAAGSPARTYRRLGELYTARAAQLASFKSRLLLPGFVMLVALLVGPLPNLVLGKIGLLGYVWQAVCPLFVIAAVAKLARALPCWLGDGSARQWADALLPRLPLFGRVVVRTNARDFFETLALLLEAGVPMLGALPKAEDAVQNSLIRRQYEQLLPAIEAGAPLAQALLAVRALGDERVLTFVQTGEAAGTLPEMLFRHADIETGAINHFYEQVAVWAPRVLYGLLMLWMAARLLGGPGIMPQVPKDL
jgi:general secretion pathway protein F